MVRVLFLPEGRLLDASPDQSLLQVALQAGIPHTHVCGGTARCSTCRVRILKGLEHCTARTPEEARLAERLRFGPEIRLACQTRVTGDVEVRRLVLDPDDVRLTDHQRGDATTRTVGEQKRVAVMFADIRGFTAFAEKLPPYDVVHTLSRYFFRMDRVIRQYGGYIDNYMGDGLMALFGVDGEPGAAFRAVEAGLGMLREVDALAPYFRSIHGKSFHIGIGIHYGDVVMGTIAPPGADKLTAIGDTVNFASRIENANKHLGTSLLISETLYRMFGPELRCRRHDCVAIPGKTGTYVLYEVLGLAPELSAGETSATAEWRERA